MTPVQEDACIEELSVMLKEGQPLERVREHCRNLAKGFFPVVRRARWVYTQYLRQSQPHCGIPPSVFSRRHWQAWQDFLLSAAQAGNKPIDVPECARGQRKLFFCWHFPEYPHGLRMAKNEDVLIFVTRRPEWMQTIVGPGALCNFRQVGLNLAITQAFQTGRKMFAMMDFCYPDTAQIAAEFLGRPARTPIGLLKMAQRYDYEVQLVSVHDGQPSVPDAFAPADFDLAACVKRINVVIEKEILRDPPRWLSWAIAANRWEWNLRDQSGIPEIV